MDPRVASFHQQSAKVLEHLHAEYAKLQTGRANAAIVDHVLVDAYGQKQELRSVAGVSVQDARSLVIQPWDREILSQVEAALNELDLGTSPVNDGVVIRINLPPMTEDRRKEMTKVVQKLAEEARISIRQQRQAVHDKLKAEENDEDQRYTLLEQLEKGVKEANEKIDESRKKKEGEIMTV
ncbi:ribosome recycling factor [Candidatus Peribacteria bacterium RIFOXYC1_FULL_54_13]|nr:MAG: Ribosome-recycling factor [Candidatus Peribacteria bacterium GW2011_GWB1_54_5]KKW40804.1 MAG: Ribosome-recycling factor [Candidatus Peregrinibacteria bacterium GW2011_GWA2_54_9]OGJ70747.1 MAG: ribosome recycling factor [Candidatus Peribacteria bacterium RIFOXYA1_FULL_56_14]OGJ74165.1 MAG: ribosome recycling factor [Candidatus Peribacteria bacterium RIFOXYA2_FULL_55_28]OGJ75596.1 MAG: ribosome recycling factor [Candidatus Peribacteria bacterium RIFOXYB1_FULL_54_35]OGJ76228.1 MAG: riboso